MKNSINFCLDEFKPSDFIDFSPDRIMARLNSKEDKELFKNRRRSVVFIIWTRIATPEIFGYLEKMFDATSLNDSYDVPSRTDASSSDTSQPTSSEFRKPSILKKQGLMSK